jgi:putative flippase GtrA
MHVQLGIYFFVAVGNLVLNTVLMYLFVEKIGLYYLIAQIVASALIAVESFFVYQRLIFRRGAAL